MSNPKIDKFHADMRTHCTVLCPSAKLEVAEERDSFCEMALFVELAGAGMLALTAAGTTRDEAEHAAIAAVWWSIHNFDKNFSPCYRDSCDVCARLLGVEPAAEPDGRVLRSHKK